MATIGERITQARERRQWSQGELARRAGLKPPTISRYESNRRQPGGAELIAVARALEVSPAWLMTGVGPADAPDPIPIDTDLTLRWQDLEARVRSLEAARGSVQPDEPARPSDQAVDPTLLARIGAWPLDDDDAPVELDQEVAAGARGGWLADDGPPAPETPRGRLARQYVVRITGTCLEGYASPGDEAVFWPRDTADIGDLVVVADGDQALIKFLAEDQAVQYLLPLVGDAIPLRPDMRIVGVVAHVRRPPPRPPRLPRRPAPHPPGEDPP